MLEKCPQFFEIKSRKPQKQFESREKGLKPLSEDELRIFHWVSDELDLERPAKLKRLEESGITLLDLDKLKMRHWRELEEYCPIAGEDIPRFMEDMKEHKKMFSQLSEDEKIKRAMREGELHFPAFKDVFSELTDKAKAKYIKEMIKEKERNGFLGSPSWYHIPSGWGKLVPQQEKDWKFENMSQEEIDLRNKRNTLHDIDVNKILERLIK